MTAILTEHGLPARGYRKHTGWKPVLLYIILGVTLSHAQTPNHTIYYGANSNALGVAFADTTLSVSNQTLIVADLNHGRTARRAITTLKTCFHFPRVCGIIFPFSTSNPKPTS